MKAQITRGDIVLVDLSGARGHEKQNGKKRSGEDANGRPCLVIQNDRGNAASDLTIVAPLTDIDQFKRLPIQVLCQAHELGEGADKDGVVECGHIRSIDEERIIKPLGRISNPAMARVDRAVAISVGLT